MNAFLAPVGIAHRYLAQRRRFDVLAKMLSEHIPPGASVLDIGCGPGTIGRLIKGHIPSVCIRGLEVMARPHCDIQCDLFSGRTIPLSDNAVDVCLFVDVLHHTTEPELLFREACRVSRRYILMKDHLCESRLDRATLTFMDWVSNRPKGVSLPYNYQSTRMWANIFAATGVRVRAWETVIPLYPFPFDRIFGRQMHFIALLEKQAA